MLAGTANITIEQGAAFSQLILWKDASGNPVDITNYTAKFQIRASKEDTTALISLTQASGLTLGGAAGTIAISLTDTQTAALTFVKCYYDLLLTPSTPANSSIRLLEGFVFNSKRVSR